MIADWLAFWRETGNHEAIARELSADVPRLQALRRQYRAGQILHIPLDADEIEPVMRAVADVSRASGVSVSELVKMADSRKL